MIIYFFENSFSFFFFSVDLLSWLSIRSLNKDSIKKLLQETNLVAVNKLIQWCYQCQDWDYQIDNPNQYKHFCNYFEEFFETFQQVEEKRIKKLEKKRKKKMKKLYSVKYTYKIF